MKKAFKVLLLSSLLLLGSCSSDSASIGDLSVSIPNISYDSDFLDNFTYSSTVAGQYLSAMANAKGYTISMESEIQVAPDEANLSRKYQFKLSERGELTWASIEEFDFNGNSLRTYRGALKGEKAYYDLGDGKGYQELTGVDISYLPYTIQQIKGALFVAGTYLKYVSGNTAKKTRTTEIDRECVKYVFQDGEGNKKTEDITILIDRESELLIHLTHYKIDSNNGNIRKEMLKVNQILDKLDSREPVL